MSRTRPWKTSRAPCPLTADDEPRPVGQIVEEDEGVREDVEKDTVALEDPLGPGGLGPEDQALYRTDSP